MKLAALVVAAMVGGAATQAHAAFTAVNDFGGGDRAADTGGDSPEGATNYTIGANEVGSGFLKDFDTNTDTAVTLTVATPDGYDAALAANDSGALADPGTDAYAIFNGKLNGQGYLWYNNSTNSRVRLTLSGLSTDATYTVSLFGNRNGNYDDRFMVTEIFGVDSYVNTSSTGDSGATATIEVGNNTATGYVAQYGDIVAGNDGEFYIDVYGGNASLDNEWKWYLNGMSVTEVPEPATAGLLSLAGLAMAARRRRA